MRALRVKTLSLVLITIFVLGMIPPAVWAGETLERGNEVLPQPFEGYDLDWIYIFYDDDNETMTTIAESVHEIVTIRLNHVKLVPITTLQDMEFWLLDQPWIAVYVFNSGIDGVHFPEREASWESFYKALAGAKNTQHVVGLANTLTFDRHLRDGQENIHHSESEQVDALLLVMYDVWALSEITAQRAATDERYEEASTDLRQIAIRMYADNFNNLLQMQANPQNPIGEVDMEALEERTKDMWDRHQPQIRKTAYHKHENGTLTEIPPEELPEDFEPTIKLSPASAVTNDDYVLGELPLFSGLRGPIGEIVDVLLDVLFDSGETTLSIPSSVMETVQTTFQTIKELIGLADDFDAESVLKSLLLTLKSEFPFIDEFKDYLDIFVKLLFNLRGDLSDIIEVVGELIEALLQDILPESVSEVIDEALDMGDGLWTAIGEVVDDGENIFDAIVAYFSESVLSQVLSKALTQTLGLAELDVENLLGRMGTFIETMISYLVSFDLEQLVDDVVQNLIVEIFGSLDANAEDVFHKIMIVMKLALGAIDFADSFGADSTIELVMELLQEVIGSSDITQDVEELVRSIMDIVKNYKEQSLTSINDFVSEVSSVLDAGIDAGVPQSTRDIVIDTITLVCGIYNDGFDPSQIPDMFEIAEDLIDEFAEWALANSFTLAQTPQEMKDAVESAVKVILGVIAMVTDSDDLKQIISKTGSQFNSEFGDIFEEIRDLIKYLDVENELGGLSASTLDPQLEYFGEMLGGITALVNDIKDESFQGVLQSIWMGIGSFVGVHPSFDDVPIDTLLEMYKWFFPEAFGIPIDEQESSWDIISMLTDMVSGKLTGDVDLSTFTEFLNIAVNLKDLFTNGMDWLVGTILDWLYGLVTPLIEDLEEAILGVLGGDQELLGYHSVLPIGLGDWSLFDLTVDLGIIANFGLDASPLFEMIKSVILEGKSALELDDIGDFFKIIFSFFEISPQFYAELGVEGFDTGSNSFFALLLSFLGVDLEFSGSARFVLNLFTFRGGVFEWDNFLKVVEWGLTISITLSKKLTLLDFLTGGVGGGALNKVAEFLGLDTISVTISFGIMLEIVKKAATATAPEESSLTITLTLGVALEIPINLLIVSITIIGSLEIILTFFQDLASSAPMKITLRLVLTFTVKLFFLVDDIEMSWEWEPGGPWDLSPSKGDADYDSAGIGFDNDQDGLSNTYEDSIPGLDKDNPDTDGDGAGDKLEVQTMGTDATNPDCDADGLLDGEEWDLGTNPKQPDSDYEGVSDYDEVNVYMTDPLSQDTDGDGLSDAYEIYTKLDLSNCTPTVTEVTIGGETYNDRTDPLVEDTDGDGIVDGDEGPMAAYYGMSDLYNDTEENEGSGDWVMDPNPLIFNYGYTHPLDADTDDDSYYQLYNGMIDTQLGSGGDGVFLKDMNDGAEIAGFNIIVWDEEGEPELKRVFTNPCNPDTDGDTGITDKTPQPGAWLNSDGYELAQNPPTDPTDGDSDDDGLLDGLEGVLNQWSNHTNAWDPDTDDDGLYDMQELLMGTDPRTGDTDFDMIPDGQEFYIFKTNPLIADSDLDAIPDGEEVFIWHTNPMSDDSDNDRLLDADEILIYGSDPMDEDGDNDGLTDFEEIKVYYTDPFTYDTDDDGLSDGEEILYYDTDPLAWDTDLDSITEPNEDGDMTWPMNDYLEVKVYGTNATTADSDMDGLSDSLELYLGAGIIPWTDPIALDPVKRDTDGDGFPDGAEIQLINVTDIIYPYRAETLYYQYNTSPILPDTDFDNISDYEEVMTWHTNPTLNDTDNDTLSDWEEIYVYNTSALFNDTDGDGLYDWEETLTPIWPLNTTFTLAQDYGVRQGIYDTSATDPDSDQDWLPDGYEVFLYGTDPNDDDSDGDGIKDTNEFDTDYDELSDGLEFKIGTTRTLGGIYEPDSDFDGLLDGIEYWVHGTDPTKSDTDGDGYSDGAEIAVGTDPLTWTSQEEFETALAIARGYGTLRVMLPVNGTEVYQNTPVNVVNLTNFQDMWFRFKNGTEEWNDNNMMTYNPATQQWWDNSVRFSPGPHILQVVARDYNGTLHIAQIYFIVYPGNDPTMFYILLIIAGAVAAVVIVGGVGWKLGWWGKLRKRLRGMRKAESKGKGEKKGGKKKSTKKKTSKKKSKEGGD